MRSHCGEPSSLIHTLEKTSDGSKQIPRDSFESNGPVSRFFPKCLPAWKSTDLTASSAASGKSNSTRKRLKSSAPERGISRFISQVGRLICSDCLFGSETVSNFFRIFPGSPFPKTVPTSFIPPVPAEEA